MDGFKRYLGSKNNKISLFFGCKEWGIRWERIFKCLGWVVGFKDDRRNLFLEEMRVCLGYIGFEYFGR